jgi:dUTP pyrophosphatase
MTKSSDKLEAALKIVAKQYDFSSEKWDDDYELRQAELRQLFEMLSGGHPKYTLEELLAKCTPENRHAEFGLEPERINVKIKRLHPDAVIPKYAKPGDAGFDLVATEDVIVEPGETVKVPTGLAFEIPEGFELQIRPRSGITTKTKLRVQLGTIDSPYRGEVKVIVDNIAQPGYVVVGVTDGQHVGYDVQMSRVEKIKTIDNSEYLDEIYHPKGTYIIRKGDRIGQGIIAPVSQAQFIEVDELGKSDRGISGFGSTGTSGVAHG